MNDYYVYEWYDVDTGEVFYVGKGKKDRWKSQKSRNKYFQEYYKFHNCGVRKIQENMSEEDAFALERKTILKYRNLFPILCNVDDGGRKLPILKGEKNPMYKISPKDRMDKETYEQWKYKHTLMIGEKNPNYGKHTLKGKYKMDKAEALRRQSRPGSQNGRATPIKVYDKNHNFIKEFDYIGEACEYLVQEGFTKSSVNSIRGNIWKANKDKSMYLKHYFEY